jgi:hypothetical protein
MIAAHPPAQARKLNAAGGAMGHFVRVLGNWLSGEIAKKKQKYDKQQTDQRNNCQSATKRFSGFRS